MYYEEHELSNRKIESILGKPVKGWIKGSGLFFIKYLAITNEVKINSLTDFKGVFELYEGGFLLRTFKSDKRIYIPVGTGEIKWIKIKKGQEIIAPVPLSPMWILLKMGISTEIARYFKIFPAEYGIDETLVKIKTDRFSLKLGSNGYSFSAQEKFFSRLKLSDKLIIVKSGINHA